VTTYSKMQAQCQPTLPAVQRVESLKRVQRAMSRECRELKCVGISRLSSIPIPSHSYVTFSIPILVSEQHHVHSHHHRIPTGKMGIPHLRTKPLGSYARPMVPYRAPRASPAGGRSAPVARRVHRLEASLIGAPARLLPLS